MNSNNIPKQLQERLWSYIIGESVSIHLTPDEAKYVHTLVTRDQTFPFITELRNYTDASLWEKFKIFILGVYHERIHHTGVIGEMAYYKGRYYLLNIKIPS